jgi:hypothetical protein
MALCSYQSYHCIRKTTAIVMGMIVLLMASTASANRVTLVATVNNQIILSPASWSIFKLSDKELQEPIATLPRLTGTVHLPAGQYRATVKQKHITKQTEFRVESNTDRTVTIALD